MLLNAEPDASVADEEGRTPLHVAALNGHSSCVVLLLKKGQPVDASDKRGQTPLHLAGAGRGALRCVGMPPPSLPLVSQPPPAMPMCCRR
jgi:hypothetical protein